MDKAIKEAKLYKQRVEQLEKENLALKKSVYDVLLFHVHELTQTYTTYKRIAIGKAKYNSQWWKGRRSGWT
jgi:hypothetical protein